MQMSLRTKITLAMALVALLVVGAVLAVTYHLRSRQLLEEFQVFVRSVAGTTALALSGDEIATVREGETGEGAAFRSARAVLEQARQINGLAEQEIYIMRPVREGGFEMEFLVMLQKKTFVGDRYEVPEANRPLLAQAWRSGVPVATGMYIDKNGHWISGYAPVRDRAGKPVALLEVDAEVSRFERQLRRDLLVAAGIGCGAFAVAMVPGLMLARGITRGLNVLSNGMLRFRSGDHGVQVLVPSRDEVGELAAVFNEMILSLGEKLALLPYVSRFTAEAVRRSREDPSWLTGAEREVMVLFADLRGFTRFSELREATDIVRQLNQLLAVQADVVVSAGGDIDKFIGDAVMAVFLEHEHSADSVFECACRLLQQVRETTVRGGWDLALGIGIHRGRAVVGSIGSETRRDFTAIGHTVNVASRFCDHAGAWEVIVSEPFYEQLGQTSQARFVETEPMRFKNVAGPMRTYRFTLQERVASG